MRNSFIHTQEEEVMTWVVGFVFLVVILLGLFYLSNGVATKAMEVDYCFNSDGTHYVCSEREADYVDEEGVPYRNDLQALNQYPNAN